MRNLNYLSLLVCGLEFLESASRVVLLGHIKTASVVQET